jgi:hypothetical protein
MFGLNIPWAAYAIAGMLAILAGTNAYTYFKATAAAEGRCRAAELAAALAVAQADLANTQIAAQRDRDAVERLTQSDTENRQRLEEYARTINGNPGCAIDAEWLRRFGGGPGAPRIAPGGRVVPADPDPHAPPAR